MLDRADVVKFISEYQANENARNKLRSTTLDMAEYGADDDGNDNANDLLHVAAEEGNIDAVQSLLERGMDTNTRNPINQTPLGRAITNGKFDVACLLIERGAEVDSPEWGWTSLHRSSREDTSRSRGFFSIMAQV